LPPLVTPSDEEPIATGGRRFCMAKRLQYRRLLILALLLSVAFVGLGYRLVDLQVLRHEELSARAGQNTQRRFLLEPRRGDILDCRGNLLATSTFVKTVCADPSLLGNRSAEVARVLAPLLQMNERDVLQCLLPRTHLNEKGETVTNQFARVKARIPVETWDKIQTAMTNLSFGLNEKQLPRSEQTFYRTLRQKAIFARDDQIRVYPNQALAAHVLGFAQTEEHELDGVPVADIIGRDGIELTLNSKLSGVRGWRQTETDHRGREMVSLREQDVEARDGLNVVLTLDTVIQNILESALAEAMDKHSPISVSGVVIRPRTGEILAMATLPSYDPNNPGRATPDERRDRIVTDVAEPGSAFKIVVVSGALNDRTVGLEDMFDCEHGHFAYAGRVLHDHEAYGGLSVRSIITKSSNIGAAKIGLKMGENRLYDYIRAFGFGERTGLPLPGEVRGIAHPVRNWSKVSIAQIPMGQGIAVTRLQMLMAMSAVADRGWLMRPMIVDHLEDPEGNVVARYTPQPVRQVISEPAARLMVEALKTVVSPEGTAPKAALEHYTVAGKTGTAQKVENGAYVHGKYLSSFTGFFPADNPELCISIFLDEPREGYYGGAVAGPVFRQIAERAASYLNIRPDLGGPGSPDTLAQVERRPVRIPPTTEGTQ
jgi:cell division protein FtsI/penicillin-binding protein 2